MQWPAPLSRRPAAARAIIGRAAIALIVAFAWSTGPAVPPAIADDAHAGAPDWTVPAPGFEVAELAVMEDGAEVERLHLARIDPANFKFEVHAAPEAARELDEWMKVTGAILIVNGSYFDKTGKPATPVISRGRQMGPTRYGTKHGAFIVSPAGTGVVDLHGTRWQQAFAGASEAMVSFPMLIGADHRSRAQNSNPDLLANRSFVGQDSRGRIIIGTTHAGYFSLDRFADYLADANLDLQRALNLDGGPPACQAIAIGTYRRNVCANTDAGGDSRDQLRVLGQLFGQRPWGLPIVLAVFPK